MDYKCLSANNRSVIVTEFLCEDINLLYYPIWLNDHESITIDQVQPLLGAMNSENIKLKTLKTILYKISVLIHKFDISELLEESDIDRLIAFSQDPAYQNTGISNFANSIIALIFTYPPNISKKLYEHGLFDQMINNFLNSYWLNGLAYYCHSSIENRDRVFDTFLIPQKLCEFIQSDETKEKYLSILSDIANFSHSLCTFPLSNESQFEPISFLFSFLANSLSKAKIEAENSILAALTAYSTLNPNFLMNFSQFNIFPLYSQSLPHHQVHIIRLATLMTAVMNYSYDYALYLAQNEDCWQIISHYFEYLVNFDSDLYKRGCLIISDAAIIMSNLSPDDFIKTGMHLQFISLYDKLPFDVKYKISMLFYAVFERATQTQIQELIENNDYRLILLDYFPDVNNSKFIMGANGYLSLLNYMETNREDLLAEFFQSDDFQSNLLKWIEEQQQLTDVSEEMSNLISLIISRNSQYQEAQ